jgi:hypothetical protein
MLLALTSEICHRVSRKCKFISKEAKDLKENVLRLAQILIKNYEEQKIEFIFLDQDFRGFNLFKIASLYSFHELLDDIKVDKLLECIWQGPKLHKCEGEFKDFSMIAFLKGKIQYLPGEEINFKKAFHLNKNFIHSMKSHTYWFQFES